MKTVTLKTIAEKVGVSPATVSLAMRDKQPNRGILLPHTVKRIQETAKKMGYRPNRLAINLVNQKANMVGVLVSAIFGDFYSGILSGIEKVCGPYSPVLSAHYYDAKLEKQSLEAFIENHLSGIICAFTGCAENIELYREISQDYKCPIVLVDREIPGLDLPVVRTDQFAEIKNATSVLCEMGHKRIVYVSRAPKLRSAELRMEGYFAAMEERKLEKFKKVIAKWISITMTKAELRQFAKEALDQWQSDVQRASALLVDNDWLAYEILDECKSRGIKVPDDLSIMGLDDCSPSSLSSISLSSVSQNTEIIGCKAGELLLKLINGERWDGKPILLPTKVVLRNTTRPI